IDGCGRFLERVWRLTVEESEEDRWRDSDPSAADVELLRATHRLKAKVGHDLERWSFNTAVAACMEFANRMQRYRRETEGGPHRATFAGAADTLLLVLAPMVPHVTAEAWEHRHGEGARIHAEHWPDFDPELSRADTVTMVVQVNGKVRDRIDVPPDITEEEALRLAYASAKVAETLGGAQPDRVVARPPRLVNFVRA
ncbi:MAG: class I tRNA ligase family protein, partial [Acidimicrobiales bacterium]